MISQSRGAAISRDSDVLAGPKSPKRGTVAVHRLLARSAALGDECGALAKRRRVIVLPSGIRRATGFSAPVTDALVRGAALAVMLLACSRVSDVLVRCPAVGLMVLACRAFRRDAIG